MKQRLIGIRHEQAFFGSRYIAGRFHLVLCRQLIRTCCERGNRRVGASTLISLDSKLKWYLDTCNMHLEAGRRTIVQTKAYAFKSKLPFLWGIVTNILCRHLAHRVSQQTEVVASHTTFWAGELGRNVVGCKVAVRRTQSHYLLLEVQYKSHSRPLRVSDARRG